MDDRTFLGKGWGFPPEFRKSGDTTKIVVEDEDIRQSITILLNTIPGERPHRYDFGCGIRRFAYEQMTLTNQTLMKEVIEKAILMFEPRIILERIGFDMSHEPEGMVHVLLEYMVLKTNRRSNMVYPFYLREGTDIDL